jgi:hypothetical protein
MPVGKILWPDNDRAPSTTCSADGCPEYRPVLNCDLLPHLVLPWHLHLQHTRLTSLIAATAAARNNNPSIGSIQRRLKLSGVDP